PLPSSLSLSLSLSLCQLGLPVQQCCLLRGRDHGKCDHIPLSISPQSLTGLPISTYFSAVKLRWLLDHVEPVAQATHTHTALFRTVDSWLIWDRQHTHTHTHRHTT